MDSRDNETKQGFQQPEAGAEALRDVEESPEEIRRRENLAKLMLEVDARVPSPAVRARKVWGALDKENITIWDLMCFCSETLGYLAPNFPELVPGIKQVVLDIYSTHYTNTNQLEMWETQIPDDAPPESPMG